MPFRVTTFAIENQAIRFAARHSADLFRAQQQISSGLRFTRPSEAPTAFRQVSSLNSRFGELNIELATIRTTEAILNSSVSQLQEANTLLTAASTAVQQGIQSIETIDSNALASEVEGILDQLQSIANTIFNGEFLYGGTKTDRPPYTFGPPSATGRSLTATYSGSDNNSVALIGNSLAVDGYYTGNTIFGAGQRGTTQIFGNTGAQTGTGTDSLRSRAGLQVTHGTTTIGGGSGLVPGTSSGSLDSIIGSHQLTIVDTSGTGTSGTIALNNGVEVPFNNTETNLEVIGPTGEVVYIDTTSFTAGFSGTVVASATGFLSVDDGITQTAIDFSGNQIVSDSITDGFVTIDSTAINRTGLDHLEFPGTSNVFEVLHNTIDELRNVNSLTSAEQSAVLDRELGELEVARNNILEAIGSQSTSLRTLESVGFRNEILTLEIQNQASELQATDISEATLRLTNAESLLQFTFAVTSQITSISILDFLR